MIPENEILYAGMFIGSIIGFSIGCIYMGRKYDKRISSIEKDLKEDWDPFKKPNRKEDSHS